MGIFTQEYLSFFKELRENNTREWFKENKKRFEKFVKEPFHNFVDEFILRVSEVEPELGITAKESVFRIYKDTRFSKDKTPHKLHMGAVVAPGGRQNKMEPGFYFQFSDEDVQIHGGGYMLETAALRNLRYYIASDIEAFRDVLEAESFREFYGTINGEKNKKLPKELMEAAEKEPLLYNKQFYFSAYHKPELILDENLSDIVFAHYLAGKEYIDYLKEAIKER